MDAIVLLKDNHKTVEKLFKEFEKAGGSAYKTKRVIADKVIEELTATSRRRRRSGSPRSAPRWAATAWWNWASS